MEQKGHNLRSKEIDKVIDEMTLFNDDLMSKVFERNFSATEYMLRTILNRRDVHVIDVKGQYDLTSPYVDGRNITLDIRAENDRGEEFDVEVQRDSAGSHVRRARYHGSMMDVRMLHENQEFKELRDSYVIFICQHDKFRLGMPVYHVDKIVRETGKLFNDGSHIIYVNGRYKGNNNIGKLVHDFSVADADDMYIKELADSVRHFKKNEEGRKEMTDPVERYAKKYAKEKSLEDQTMYIKNLMESMKLSLDQILDGMKISGKDREYIIGQLQSHN